jgi:uncharacterized delta-60 repeat protein
MSGVGKLLHAHRDVLIVAIFMAVVGAGVLPSRAQPGSLDITFNPGSGETQPSTYSIAIQANGQIVIGGYFTSFNGANYLYIARLNTDGSLDSSFGPALPSGAVQSLALQPDGKILVGGRFSSFNGTPRNGIARLRFDGSLDTSFTGGGPGGAVLALGLQTDGKVVVGGEGFGIARLNTNGTPDVAFNIGTGLASGYVGAIGLQSDSKIIVGGNFTSINGVSRNYLVRLNTNGSVDAEFDANVALGSVYSKVVCLAVLPQDKIVIGGIFSSINGYSRNGIARLNADGSVDTAFNPGLGPDGPVVGIAVQDDGKVVIGGGFGHVNGTNRVNVARLNTDGSLDLAFNPGAGANNNVDSVAMQSDGKTLIGGEFMRFNGTNINGIARLNGDTFPTTNLQFMASHLYFGMNLSGVVSNVYRIEYTSNFDTPSLWTPLFNVTLQTNPQFILDPNPALGQRFYRAVRMPAN